MRVVYTEEALENLDEILAYIASNPTDYGWNPKHLDPEAEIARRP